MTQSPAPASGDDPPSSASAARKSRADVLQTYADELQQWEDEIRQRTWRTALLSTVRGLLLLGTLILFGWGWFNFGSSWWVPGLLIGFLFFGVAAWQENGERLLRLARTRKRILDQSLAAMRRDFQQLPAWKLPPPAERAATARDLDLVGATSLARLLGQARTPQGKQHLLDWLLRPPRLTEVHQRQEAVRQLAERRAWRERLQLTSELLAASESGPEALIDWVESPAWLGSRPWLKWLARATSTLVLVLLVLLAVGGIDKQVGSISLVVLCAMNFGLTVAFAGAIHPLFNQVSSRQNDVAHYRKLFQLIDELRIEGAFAKQLHSDATHEGQPAYRAIDRLGQIMVFANLRRSGLFGILYLFLQFLFLWDFHALAWLERWQDRCRDHVRRWFLAVGRAEAISCLAKLAHDEPAWIFPEVVAFDNQSAQLTAKSLGHPLLEESVRVCNDVQVGPVGSVLLVTGSNMSGKSTLLRALGVNLALAQAGTKVCADSFRSPLVQVETSMRISDSLSEGVSFFMAELKRLKQIVDLAEQAAGQDELGFFYLLDEILQGTNSKERHVAVQEVLKHLLEVHAIGAISTHDLELATAEGLVDRCQPVHFRETIDLTSTPQKMTFDYQLRQGVATTTNALKLLELVGLKRAGDL